MKITSSLSDVSIKKLQRPIATGLTVICSPSRKVSVMRDCLAWPRQKPARRRRAPAAVSASARAPRLSAPAVAVAAVRACVADMRQVARITSAGLAMASSQTFRRMLFMSFLAWRVGGRPAHRHIHRARNKECRKSDDRDRVVDAHRAISFLRSASILFVSVKMGSGRRTRARAAARGDRWIVAVRLASISLPGAVA